MNLRVLNTISPETENTCMYFWSLVRNYRLNDATLTALQRETNAKIFEEDRVVLEAQQQRIDAMPDTPLRTLASTRLLSRAAHHRADDRRGGVGAGVSRCSGAGNAGAARLSSHRIMQ